MKRLFISCIVIIVILSGCNKSSKTFNDTNKDDILNKYTLCYMYMKNMNISQSIYYNKNYIVTKDIVLMDIKYDSLSEAIEAEEKEKERFKNSKENSECFVIRTNNIVSINCETKMPQYTYKEKIMQLENEGYKCNEVGTNE